MHLELEWAQVIKSFVNKFGKNVDLNHLDVSNVTNMSNLFACSNFNGNISNWNTSNVIDMRGMFYKSDFNQDINRWNVRNVTDMSNMFRYSNFDQDIIKECYDGIIPKGKILDVLKHDYPEYFI